MASLLLFPLLLACALRSLFVWVSHMPTLIHASITLLVSFDW